MHLRRQQPRNCALISIDDRDELQLLYYNDDICIHIYDGMHLRSGVFPLISFLFFYLQENKLTTYVLQVVCAAIYVYVFVMYLPIYK